MQPEVTEYDLELVSVQSDHRRLVTEYEMMLLGRGASHYFRLDRAELQEPDISKLVAAMHKHYHMVEPEDE